METRLSAVLSALALAGGAVLLQEGCGAAGDSSGIGGASCAVQTCGTTTTASSSSSSSSGSGGAPPPEKELESGYTAPVATSRYVWIANPDSGRVAYIDATSLEIRLVEAGDAPTYVAAVPSAHDDVAVVLNARSLDATVLRAHAGKVQASRVAVPGAGNGWAVSRGGRYAIAWTDARQIEKADPLDGFQSITVVDLGVDPPASAELTVGYRPVALSVDADERRAFAVSQDGVTVIALDQAGGPEVVRNVPISDDPIHDVGTRDVAITPDGGYAVVRRDGASALTLVDLEAGSRVDLALPGPVTDMDLSSDGQTAVAVVRSTAQVALIPIPGALTNPAFPIVSVAGATVGSTSLAAASRLGFFYTNAEPSGVLVTFDTSAPTPSPLLTLLRAPIAAVFPTPDARFAVVLDGVPSGDAGGSYAAAFSLVPVGIGAPAKIVGVHATPLSVAVSPSGDHALISTGDETKNTYELFVAAMPSLEVTRLPLASLPIASGVSGQGKSGFVSQKHPDGRITFVDFTTGQARTLTGFELAAQVVDGSAP